MTPADDKERNAPMEASAASAIVRRTPSRTALKTRADTPRGAADAKLVASRVTILTEIATRYYELVEPGLRGGGICGDGNDYPKPPPTYTATVREFERLMRLMRNQAKQQAFEGESVGTLRWHVNEYFVRAERVVRHVPVTVVAGGKLKTLRNADGTTKTKPIVDYLRHPDAREKKALLGVRWLALNWGLESEPMRPKELCAA